MFSVGLLYSAQEFIEFARANHVKMGEVRASFHDFGLVRLSDVLDVVQTAGWVGVDVEGRLILTDDGMDIASAGSSISKLRLQLSRLATKVQPPWLRLFTRGRAETFPYLPRDVQQCIKEADLLYGEGGEVIRWWDGLSNLMYSAEQTNKMIVGREGELKSIEFEMVRTGSRPHWKSLYSNNAGYDLLSCVNEVSLEPLCIEVKASKQQLSEAVLYVTKNEWLVALDTKNYQFHLWLLREWTTPQVATVSDMAAHIPNDQGEGAWELAVVPFLALSNN